MDKTQEENIIKIHGSQFEVTAEELASFRKFQRHIRYLEINVKRERFDKERAVFLPSKEDSLERLFDSGIDFHDDGISVEDSVIANQMVQKLHECLAHLTTSERKLIFYLFFQNKNETQVASLLGINQSNVNRRKIKILHRLKKLLEI